MRLATFNLENLDAHTGDPSFLRRRVDALRPQIERLNADILCLQEVNAQESTGSERTLMALDALIEGTPYQSFHRVHTKSVSGDLSNDRPRDRHNLVILSRFSVLTSDEIHHHLVAPPFYSPGEMTNGVPAEDSAPIAWDRPLLYAAIDVGLTKPLHLVNLHLRAPRAAFVAGQKHDSHTWASVPGWAEGYFLTAVKRAGQALETRLFVDRIFDRDADALIAVVGDFNADDFEVPPRIIRGDADDIGNPELSGRTLVPVERSLADEKRHSVIHGGHAQMLDHVFASRALMAFFDRAEVHNEMLGDEVQTAAALKKSPDSFHAPLLSIFRMPSIS